MKVYQSIEHDHHIQRKLAEQMVQTTGDSSERRQAFAALKQELAAHADAEERYFYVPLIKLDSTQQAARHGIAEHHEIDEMVETLEQTDFDSPAWLHHAKKLADKVKHHLAEEEKDYFPVAKDKLSDDRAKQLGHEYLAAMQQARTE